MAPEMLAFRADAAHVSWGWLGPGKTQDDDEKFIEDARALSPKIQAAARSIAPINMAVAGLAIDERQIMATFTAATWNATFAGMKVIRDGIPELRPEVSGGAYPLDQSPLDGEQICQATLFVSDGEFPMEPIVEALRPLLYDEAVMPFGHLGFRTQSLTMVVNEFNAEDVLRQPNTLCVADFAGSRNASHSAGQLL